MPDHLTDKAAEERAIFSRFCQLHGELEAKAFEYVDPPDFLDKQRGLAVELVEYHRDLHRAGEEGSPTRIHERDVAGVLAQARALVEREAPDVAINVIVDVEQPEWHSSSVKSKEMARRLAVWILESLPLGAEVYGGDVPDSLRFFGAICAYPADGSDEYPASPFWQVGEARIADVNVAAVQAALDKKETRLPTYRAHGKEVWLVIHGTPVPSIGAPNPGRRFSTMGHVTSELRRYVFSSSFDRAFYLDLDRKALCELQLVATGAAR